MISWQRKQKIRLTICTIVFLLLAAIVISIATGYVSLSPIQLIRTLLGMGSYHEQLTLFTFRLPRIAITLLAGMGLAVAGAILQSITRNPLADPGILGINAGAGVMVVVYAMFFTTETTYFLYMVPLFALLGSLITMLVIFLFSYHRGRGIAPTPFILVGVGMAAALNGAIYVLTNQMEREEYDFFARWIAGQIWGDEWIFVLTLLPWIVLLLPMVYAKSNVLNHLQLDETVATGLGVEISRERIFLIVIAVALAASSVSVSGEIAFLGLLAPHIARALVGPRHQIFLPVAALLGAFLLLSADTIGRVILDPMGVPAGIVMACIGAPYFLYLLFKQ